MTILTTKGFTQSSKDKGHRKERQFEEMSSTITSLLNEYITGCVKCTKHDWVGREQRNLLQMDSKCSSYKVHGTESKLEEMSSNVTPQLKEYLALHMNCRKN